VLLGSTTWRRWAVAATLARLPGNMAPLGLVLVLPGGSGALAAGAFALGIGAGAAWRGRALDRRTPRVGLRREGLALAASCALLAAVLGAGAPQFAVIAAAAAMGVAGSAVGMGYRAALPALVPPRSTQAAYLLDAVLTELSFVVSPVLAGLLATTAPPYALFSLSAVLAAVSVLAGRALPDRKPAGTGYPSSRGWLAAGAPVYLVTGGVGLGYGLLVAGLPERLAALGWPGIATSAAFAVMSGTSAVAGVLAALRGGWSRHHIGVAALLSAPFALATATLTLDAHGTTVIAAMAAFGLPLAPLSALGTSVLTARIPGEAHNRALATFAAMVTLTTGAGFALAAALLLAWGPTGVLTASAAVYAGLTGTLAICTATAKRRSPQRPATGDRT
jgi:hypothetical protein